MRRPRVAGRATAPVTVVIRLKGELEITLKIGQEQRGALPRVVGWVEKQSVFRLRAADAEKMLRGLDEYIKTEFAEPPPLPGPGRGRG